MAFVTSILTSTPIAIGLHEEPDQLQTSSGNYVGLRVEPTECLFPKQVVVGSSPIARSTFLYLKSPPATNRGATSSGFYSGDVPVLVALLRFAVYSTPTALGSRR